MATRTKSSTNRAKSGKAAEARREREALIVKAIANPLRQQILRILNERVASPKEISQELGLPLPNVSYHTKILRDYECIELVRTEPRRGAVEHFYRAIERPMLTDDQWSTLPLSARRALYGQTLGQIFEHVQAAAREGGFDHDHAYVTWTALDLDEQGWEQMSELLTSTLDRASQISADSMARTAGDGEGGVRTEVALLHFRRAEEKRGRDTARGRAKR
jgi:DNA-binding transcriptional ArsR family regulator